MQPVGRARVELCDVAAERAPPVPNGGARTTHEQLVVSAHLRLCVGACGRRCSSKVPPQGGRISAFDLLFAIIDGGLGIVGRPKEAAVGEGSCPKEKLLHVG